VSASRIVEAVVVLKDRYLSLPARFVLEHSKFAMNVAFFVRHEYILHPKLGNLQEVS